NTDCMISVMLYFFIVARFKFQNINFIFFQNYIDDKISGPLFFFSTSFTGVFTSCFGKEFCSPSFLRASSMASIASLFIWVQVLKSSIQNKILISIELLLKSFIN